MNYHIENDLFRVTVNEKGAELCSIKSLKTDREYIWQANDVWNGSAPVLFPIVGNLKGGGYTYEENEYKIPKHGFVRHNENIKLINRTKTRLSFLLSSNDETMAMYPFKFDFKVSFFLANNKLQVFHEVVNLNEKEMLFSLGGHPAFNCPFNSDESYEDYYLQFENKESPISYEITQEGLLGMEEKSIIEKKDKIPLTNNLFDDDALIFMDLSSTELSLKSKTHKDVLKVNFGDFPFLGVWAKPNANFVCIEPWAGLPDFEDSKQELLHKPGIIKLQPGNTHYASYIVEINEK